MVRLTDSFDELNIQTGFITTNNYLENIMCIHQEYKKCTLKNSVNTGVYEVSYLCQTHL